jgi:transposase-like protein
MTDYDGFIECGDWIDVEFVKRERTPEPIVEVDGRLHLAEISIINIRQYTWILDVQRCRTAIRDWVHRANLQPVPDTVPDQIAVDEAVIRGDGHREWLYRRSRLERISHVPVFGQND